MSVGQREVLRGGETVKRLHLDWELQSMSPAIDGEYILYAEHVEAMKRIAGDTTPPIVAGFVRVYDEVNGPIPAEPSATSQQASTAEWLSGKSVIAQAAPSASAQQTEPVAWWNGIRKFDPDRDSVPPSFSADEDTWHDIPLYSGFNPCNSAAPAPAAPAALTDEQVIARAEKAGFRWLPPDEDEGGFPGGFDMSDLGNMRRLIAMSATPPAAGD